jgi:uncharacterized membrane protein YgdD (TMEM256/DUF423 family)
MVAQTGGSNAQVALAAVSAAAAVGLGAFGAHGLEERLASAGTAELWETAVTYHFGHALAAFAHGVWRERRPDVGPAAGWMFLAGGLLFGATLYVLALGGPKWLGAVTPLGGVALIAGWLLAARSALRRA